MPRFTVGNGDGSARRRWHYTRNKKERVGPVSTPELKRLIRTGRLTAPNMILLEGTSKWMTVDTVRSLLRESAASRCTSVKVASYYSASRWTQMADRTPKPRRKRRRWLAALGAPIVAAALVLLVVLLFPGEKRLPAESPVQVADASAPQAIATSPGEQPATEPAVPETAAPEEPKPPTEATVLTPAVEDEKPKTVSPPPPQPTPTPTPAANPSPYRRTQAQLREALAKLRSAPPSQPEDPVAVERHAALQRLKCYRLLVGAPIEGLKLDDGYDRMAQAAARICEKIGRLDHTPKNPGLPEDEYKLAYAGATRTNLSYGAATMAASVDRFMDDSDPGNIAHTGHRRWCLNPFMGKTGFGRAGKFSAMYSFDQSQREVPDFDYIPYPAEGWMPVEYFGFHRAWTVTLNPKKYRVSGGRPDVSVYELNGRDGTRGGLLKLDYCGVSTSPFGVSPCLIFRPATLSLEPGRRYLVEIEGLHRPDGTPTSLSYTVDFFSLK